MGAPLAAVHGGALLWGGREGKQMDVVVRTGQVWRFSFADASWESLTTSGEEPEGRSYHCAAVDRANQVYWMHAGCTAQGRVSSLHSLDLKTLTWTRHPDAPGSGRGGTSIAFIAASDSSSKGYIIRWGGFNGDELGGPLAVFDVATNTWKEYDCPVVDSSAEQPPSRSVYALQPLMKPESVHVSGQDWQAIAVMALGEGTAAPKDLGHAGAGNFLRDAWVLLKRSNGFAWLPAHSLPGEELPQARGWFASDAVQEDGTNALIVHGGLNADNERLADMWRLDLVFE